MPRVRQVPKQRTTIYIPPVLKGRIDELVSSGYYASMNEFLVEAARRLVSDTAKLGGEMDGKEHHHSD